MSTRRAPASRRRARTLGAVALAASIVVAAAACPSDHVAGAGRPVDALAARLDDDRARRLRMTATVDARASGIEGFLAKAELDVAAERPDRLHLSARSFFGAPLFTVTTSGGTLSLYDAREGAARFASGPASALSLERLIGLPLDPRDVVDLLLGSAPTLPPPTARAVRVDGDTAVVTGRREDGSAVSVRVRLVDDALLEVVLGEGAQAVTATMSSHRELLGLVMPTTVEIAFVRGGATKRVVLSARDVALNGEALGDAAFVLTPPDGITVEPLE